MNKIIGLLFMMLSGCASLYSDSEYPVRITSNVEGARYEISNKAGLPVASGVTPGRAVLDASAGFFKGEEYEVKLTHPGYRPTTTYIQSDKDGWWFVNLVWLDLIGFLIIDPATGAMYKLPDRVHGELVKQ